MPWGVRLVCFWVPGLLLFFEAPVVFASKRNQKENHHVGPLKKTPTTTMALTGHFWPLAPQPRPIKRARPMGNTPSHNSHYLHQTHQATSKKENMRRASERAISPDLTGLHSLETDRVPSLRPISFRSSCAGSEAQHRKFTTSRRIWGSGNWAGSDGSGGDV